ALPRLAVSDTAHKFPPAQHNHLAVLRKNRFAELSAAELEVQLTRIRNTVMQPGVPVGALTLDNHDNWTHAREALLALPGNAEKAQLVESAMIVLCLDDSAPITREEIWAAWVGNRWYDKHQRMSFI
ncbi:hypothetical protein H0H87_009922, partial [Tephrocybe sp. NHM501043]